MKSEQDRFFNYLENFYNHVQFETPKRLFLAALTDDSLIILMLSLIRAEYV